MATPLATQIDQNDESIISRPSERPSERPSNNTSLSKKMIFTKKRQTELSDDSKSMNKSNTSKLLKKPIKNERLTK